MNHLILYCKNIYQREYDVDNFISPASHSLVQYGSQLYGCIGISIKLRVLYLLKYY